MQDKGTLLVIDDTPQNIEILSEALEDSFHIVFATNGADGLERAIADTPDLILLDVMMPDMDGYEVCARLKEDHRTQNIPVIFVTALTAEEDETRGLALGAIDYITKPFSIPIVQARMRNHLELKRYRDFLSDLAYRDGLTTIPNRRHYEEFLDREWRRTAREEKPLSVILIDIDHFKKFNDNYGHQAGDECLRKVAIALHDTAKRPGDLVARYGGEEFVCVLSGTDATGAEQAALRLCESVRQLGIPHEHSGAARHVTISLGVATMIPTHQRQPDELLTAADSMLYAAKEAGRNGWKARAL